MSKQLYNKTWAKNTIYLLEEELKDLSLYSVYNDDIFNQEIFEIEEAVKKVKEKI